MNVQNMQPVQKECKEEFTNHSKLHVDFVLIVEEENVMNVDVFDKISVGKNHWIMLSSNKIEYKILYV